MKAGIIGVGHWHNRLYYNPLKRMSGVEIVAVSDQDPEVARQFGSLLGCRAYQRHEELLERDRPDIALVLGRHVDMPVVAQYLISRKVPFCVEKPAGISAQKVRKLDLQAQQAGVIIGVPFVYRLSEVVKIIKSESGGEPFSYLSFKFIAGSPQRYIDKGCHWMLRKQESGGGCTINLSVHFFDLFACLTGERAHRVYASMNSLTHGLEVEDYSLVVITSQRNMCCSVETGYTLPAGFGALDLGFTLRTANQYFIVSNGVISVINKEGSQKDYKVPTTNVPYYPSFVEHMILCVRDGVKPVAGLKEMADVLDIVEAAYRSVQSGQSVSLALE